MVIGYVYCIMWTHFNMEDARCFCESKQDVLAVTQSIESSETDYNKYLVFAVGNPSAIMLPSDFNWDNQMFPKWRLK